MKRKEIIIAIAIVVGLGTWAAYPLFRENKNSLPADLVSFEQFIARMPPPRKIVTFDKDGESFIEAVGVTRRYSIHFPSGPPVYIFAADGTLRYWHYDIGETNEYEKLWGKRANEREISIQQAREIISKQQK